MESKYADGPLVLIPTPHKESGKTDNFTMDASHMAIVHNVIVRGYNSIYKQARYIRSHDVRDFIGYCTSWNDMVLGHHRSEETVLFPLLEQGAGVPGLMDTDKNEHEAFYDGLGEFKNYLDQCAKADDPSSAFDGERLIKLMDAFGPALHSHLSHEPPHIASLAQYPSIDMVSIKAKTEKDAMDHSSPVFDLPMLWFNLDIEFEDGRWSDFPGLSWPLKWVMVNVFGWWRSNWWRFGSVGRDGKRQQLLALRDGY